MSKFVQSDKIDLIIPEEKVKSSAFITPTTLYKIDDIVTKKEIDDSIILQDSVLKFTSICKVPIESASVILKYPDSSTFPYFSTDIK
jgi:hypothetical protein